MRCDREQRGWSEHVTGRQMKSTIWGEYTQRTEPGLHVELVCRLHHGIIVGLRRVPTAKEKRGRVTPRTVHHAPRMIVRVSSSRPTQLQAQPYTHNRVDHQHAPSPQYNSERCSLQSPFVPVRLRDGRGERSHERVAHLRPVEEKLEFSVALATRNID